MNQLASAAAILGKAGGKAGTGAVKARSTAIARAAAMARWSDPERIKNRFWSYVKIGSGAECWPWTGTMCRGGYGRVMILGKLKNAHRVAFQLTHGRLDPAKDICHHCDNPPCCNPAHLFEGTTSDNMRDCVSKGRRHAKGSCNSNSRFTEQEVEYIRSQVAGGHETMADIARFFNVSHECIRMIVKRIKWKHI